MKPFLHSSLVKISHLETYLEIAHNAGFKSVEFDLLTIEKEVQKTGLIQIQQLFGKHQIMLDALILPVDVYDDESVFQADLNKLPELIGLASMLGANRCYRHLWPFIDELPVPYAGRLAKRLRLCADILSAYGMRLGLEFIGSHHLRNKRYPFVYTIQDTLDYIDGIGVPNIGLLQDSFHQYTTEASLEDILRCKSAQIVHVHVNDTDRLSTEANSNERLLPGEGIIDLRKF